MSVFVQRFSRFIAVLALVASIPAFAHAHPKEISPAADSTVSAPSELSIHFSEALEAKFSKLEVTDAKGTAVTKQPAVLDSADSKHLTLPLPTLSAGVYHVHWVSAATDGHRLEGNYMFTVK